MHQFPQKVAFDGLGRLLRPIVRYCVRHSLHLQDATEALKLAFIRIAEEEIAQAGGKINISRLSAVTGRHRRDVMRLHRDEQVVEEPRGLVSRIIGQWQQDKRYRLKSGKPRVLTLLEFQDLVREISQDLKPGTVLFELERVGAITKKGDSVRLATRGYLPKGDIAEGLALLESDFNDLVRSVEENIVGAEPTPKLHVKTEYDAVDPDAIPFIRALLIREGSALHQKARNFISKFDREINPAKGKKKVSGESVSDSPVVLGRVTLGSFSLAYVE